MKKSIGTIFLLSCISSTFAAPLREADLSPDATWLAHADVQAARVSPHLVKLVQETITAPKHPLAQFQQETGFDFVEHLDGITAYGSGAPGEGAIIVRHHFSNAQLEAWLIRKNCTKATHGGTTVYLFPLTQNAVSLRTLSVAFPSEGVIVVAAQDDALRVALARLNAAPTATLPPEFRQLGVTGPFLTGIVDADALRMKNGNLNLLKQVRRAAFAVSANGARLDVDGCALMLDENVAQTTAGQLEKAPAAAAIRVMKPDALIVATDKSTLHIKIELPEQVILAQVEKLRDGKINGTGADGKNVSQ